MEIVLSFVIGFSIVGLLAFLFSLKTKGFFRIIINSLCGALALLLFSIFRINAVALNPLNALIVGALGTPGLIALWIFSVFSNYGIIFHQFPLL